MHEQESITKDSLHDWADLETRSIDVVASWESLCSTYDLLKFSDALTDSERLEEFKWIVHQMNIFLAKMRKKMLGCQDRDAMTMLLMQTLNQSGDVRLDGRRTLVYQKLRQQWIQSAINRLNMMEEDSYGE